MRIHPNNYESTVEESRATTLTADHEILATLECSNDQLNWVPGPTILLPADLATPLPRVALNFTHFRLRINNIIPQMVNIQLGVTEPEGDDLVVTDIIKTRSATIERDESGNISKVVKAGGREIEITRDEDGNVTELGDGARTWSINRDEDGEIDEVAVT